MKQIPKFLNNLANTPLMLSADAQLKLDAMIDKVLNSDVVIDEMAFTKSYTPKTIEQLEYDAERGIGVVNVTGLLVDKYDPELKWWYGDDGVTSYEELSDNIDTLLEAGAHTIIQYNNSGGGQAYNVFETANSIRKKLDEKEAVMITYSDGITASASFALASVSDEIIAHPDSDVGSVGVVVSLLDTSEYMKNLGLKREFITAGKGKVPYDKDGKFTKEFLDDIQAGVDETYDKFTSHISSNRPITKEKLVEVGAKVFSSKEAQSVGYIDKRMTKEEFSNYFEDELNNKGNTMSFLDKLTKANKETKMSHDKPNAEEQLATVRTAVEAEYAGKLTELQNQLTQARAEFESKISEKDAEVEALKQSLREYEAEKAAKAEAEATAKAEARVTKLKELLGDAKGEALAKAYETLSDEVFESTVSALSATVKTQNEELEEEEGGEGAEVITHKSALEEANARAAAEIAKQFGKKQ